MRASGPGRLRALADGPWPIWAHRPGPWALAQTGPWALAHMGPGPWAHMGPGPFGPKFNKKFRKFLCPIPLSPVPFSLLPSEGLEAPVCGAALEFFSVKEQCGACTVVAWYYGLSGALKDFFRKF